MSDTPGRGNLVIACAFVDELARQGLRQVVVAPGSRSTPLVVAFAAHPDVRVWMHVDERSAAFFALGMARQHDQAVAIVCTSGTAAANVLPAVVEARYSRVPLLVLTADRPPELRDWGAAQTIDQIALYGSHARWFVDMPLPEATPALLRHARAVAARAMETSEAAPAGPVHLNFPFREPLLPADLDPLRSFARLYTEDRTPSLGKAADSERGRRKRRPYAAPFAGATLASSSLPESTVPSEIPTFPTFGSDDLLDAVGSLIQDHPRGVIVCGPGEHPGLPEAVTSLSAATRYPILADPLSGVRFGGHSHLNVIDAYDAFLRDPETVAALAPDLILRTGGLPAAKTLQLFLAANSFRRHILIDPGDPRDPAHTATDHIRADPPGLLAALPSQLGRPDPGTNSSWMQTWRTINGATRRAVATYLAACDEPFEGRAVAEVAALLPDGATLVAGNSMPVRDIDTFVAGDQRRIRIVGNRGASGIDGLASSALGAAAVADGPVVLIVGDLSFYHDLNGLLAAKLHDIDCTIVVINNDGGGIFSFLPQAELLDHPTFERLFGTPTGLDFRHAAALYGATFARPADWPAFRQAVCAGITGRGLSIVELVTDRERNVSLHREVWQAVTSALRGAVPAGGSHD